MIYVFMYYSNTCRDSLLNEKCKLSARYVCDFSMQSRLSPSYIENRPYVLAYD